MQAACRSLKNGKKFIDISRKKKNKQTKKQQQQQNTRIQGI